MVLGYPLGPEFGKSLKSTRGSMVAMPDASVDNMCLYDAVTNPGNSGGPLCDKKGAGRGSGAGGHRERRRQLWGSDSYRERDAVSAAASSGSGCGLGEAKELDWPGVDAMVSPSTVLILKKEDVRGDLGVGGRRPGGTP